MTIHCHAVYQDGVLKPKTPLALPDGAEVDVTVRAGGPDPETPPIRDHTAFLKGYVPEDEGLYDDDPAR